MIPKFFELRPLDLHPGPAPGLPRLKHSEDCGIDGSKFCLRLFESETCS